jgi:hypothetical protein
VPDRVLPSYSAFWSSADSSFDSSCEFGGPARSPNHAPLGGQKSNQAVQIDFLPPTPLQATASPRFASDEAVILGPLHLGGETAPEPAESRHIAGCPRLRYDSPG